VAGDGAGLEELAALITMGHGRVVLAREGNPAPYARWLSAIEVTATDDPRVSIGYSDDRSEIVISCPTKWRKTLAWNVAGCMAQASSGSHRHEEWFPDHLYLEDDAVPLVIGRLND
jgi:hypothetical protein